MSNLYERMKEMGRPVAPIQQSCFLVCNEWQCTWQWNDRDGKYIGSMISKYEDPHGYKSMKEFYDGQQAQTIKNRSPTCIEQESPIIKR